MAWSKSVTIQQIAEKAGVSIATVSRMLNRQGNVHPGTEEKIRGAMAELGFVAEKASPAALASRRILASIPDMSNPFTDGLIKGMRETARHHGYEIFYYQPENPATAVPGYLEMLQNGYIEGVVLIHAVKNVDELEQVCERYPVVMCSEYCESDRIPYVAIDNHAAVEAVMTYLFSTGRRRIGLLNSGPENNYSLWREEAYRAQMALQGVEVLPQWVAHLPEVNFDLAVSAVTALLKAENRPEAVFCVSEIYAAAVLKAAAALGIEVPGGLAVVGFDDIDLAGMLVPPLTSVAQPTYQLGAQAINLLVDRITGAETTARHFILNTQLVVRASS